MSKDTKHETKILDRLNAIIRMVNQSEIDELEFEEPGFKVKIKKQPSVSIVSQQHHIPYNAEHQPHHSASQIIEETGKEVAIYDDKVEIITAPMVGTCYLASAPEKPSFVEVGSKVKKGSTLCIIEAMKLMNEIESMVEGEVVEIMVKTAQPIEYGEPLFAIKTF